jgi:hypothetical protein
MKNLGHVAFIQQTLPNVNSILNGDNGKGLSALKNIMKMLTKNVARMVNYANVEVNLKHEFLRIREKMEETIGSLQLTLSQNGVNDYEAAKLIRKMTKCNETVGFTG